MQWAVLLADEFEPEFLALERAVQDEILVLTRLLQPEFGTPESRYAQRFQAREHEGVAL